MRKIRILAFIAIIALSLGSCAKPFYDGEGNRIPKRVVRLLVISQFAIMTPAEQKVLDKYFYLNKYRRFYYH